MNTYHGTKRSDLPQQSDEMATLRLANGEIIEIPFNWLNGYFPDGSYTKRRRRVKIAKIEPIIPYGEINPL